MNKRCLAVALLLLVALGAGAGLLFKSRAMLDPESSGDPVMHAVVTYASDETLRETATNAVPGRTPQDVASMETSMATATGGPLQEGDEREEDIDDVLLLYASTLKRNFDVNFCMVARYYGLGCATVDLQSMELTDHLLRDAKGEYFKLVGISAGVLLGSPSQLSDDEVSAIGRAIETSGVNLLVSNMSDDLDFGRLSRMTDGAVLGATKLPYSTRDWLVSSATPEMTRELSGQVVSSWTAQQDFGLILGEAPAELTTLIASRDGSGMTYPVFVSKMVGQGSILIDGGQTGESVEEISLREMYYDDDHFSEIFPVMISIRYALGDEVWHSDQDYANLTIHGVFLGEPSGSVSFRRLLREMKAHNFHTTIALVPAQGRRSEAEVVRLIRANPDRFSLVQHGNNADGYEFYKYTVSDDDDYEGKRLPARPLAAQEADIVEGMRRMEQHRELTGIAHDRIMVFPWGMSPEPTLVLLKKYNFLATVSAQTVPLDAGAPQSWDYGMYQADTEYGDFPVLSRRYVVASRPDQSALQSCVRDLFIDKPVLLSQQAGKLFATGSDAFNPIADRVNDLRGEIEWTGLGEIVSHLHLEKKNDDGTIDVKMYGNRLIFANESEAERTYHISKPETLNVPVSGVTVNGREFAYEVEGGLLCLDVRVPPHTTAEMIIQYGG